MDVTLTPAARLPLPLLITGVSGVAGWNALPYFLRRHPPGRRRPADGDVATRRRRRRRPRHRDRAGLTPCLNAGAFARPQLHRQLRPQVVELDPAMAGHQTWTAPPHRDAARRFGARLVHLSSTSSTRQGAGGYVEKPTPSIGDV